MSRRTRVKISEISSRVPTPPGSATNASPSSIIFALRSPMVSQTKSSVRSCWATPASMKKAGSTPITGVPPSMAARDTAPISPTELPPYTSVCPARAIQAPKLRAASSKCGLSPKFDPQYTVMFMALSSTVDLICSEKVPSIAPLSFGSK